MAPVVPDCHDVGILTSFSASAGANHSESSAAQCRKPAHRARLGSSIDAGFAAIEEGDEIVVTHEFSEEITEKRAARFDRPEHAN
jgi:hypothetical protein